MKKILLSTLLLIIGLTTYAAVWQSQGEAEITFEKTTHNFGSFPESSPKVTCVFKFKNSGDGPWSSIKRSHLADVLFPNILKSPSNRVKADR